MRRRIHACQMRGLATILFVNLAIVSRSCDKPASLIEEDTCMSYEENFVYLLFGCTSDACHMRRRIHACYMTRRIHAYLLFGCTSDACHMKRRIHACHMTRRIHTCGDKPASLLSHRRNSCNLMASACPVYMYVCIHVCMYIHTYVTYVCTYMFNPD